MIKKCKNCGREFEPVNGMQLYCSPKCRDAQALVRRRLRCGIQHHRKQCVVCGKEFETFAPHKKCCSAECRDEWLKLKDKERKERWYKLNSGKRKRSAGKPPKTKSNRGTCWNCGRQFERTFTNERFCSDDCREDYFSSGARLALINLFRV